MSVIGQEVTKNYNLPKVSAGYHWDVNRLFELRDSADPNKIIQYEHTEILLYDANDEIVSSGRIDFIFYGNSQATIYERAFSMAKFAGVLA